MWLRLSSFWEHWILCHCCRRNVPGNIYHKIFVDWWAHSLVLCLLVFKHTLLNKYYLSINMDTEPTSVTHAWKKFLLFSCSVMSNSYVTPWTVSCQAPLSMGFSRQEYWSGLLFPSPGDLSDPGMEPVSSALVGRFFTTEPAGKPKRSLPNTFVCVCVCVCVFIFSFGCAGSLLLGSRFL